MNKQTKKNSNNGENSIKYIMNEFFLYFHSDNHELYQFLPHIPKHTHCYQTVVEAEP